MDLVFLLSRSIECCHTSEASATLVPYLLAWSLSLSLPPPLPLPASALVLPIGQGPTDKSQSMTSKALIDKATQTSLTPTSPCLQIFLNSSDEADNKEAYNEIVPGLVPLQLVGIPKGLRLTLPPKENYVPLLGELKSQGKWAAFLSPLLHHSR